MLQKVRFLLKNRDSFCVWPCRPPQSTSRGSYVNLLSLMLRSVAQLLLTMILERFFAPIRPLPAIPPSSRDRLIQKYGGKMCKIFQKMRSSGFRGYLSNYWELGAHFSQASRLLWFILIFLDFFRLEHL